MILNWFDTLMELDFDISHVSGERNGLVDALSGTSEPVTFAAFTIQHLVRGNTEPETDAMKQKVIQEAHAFGHLGEHAVFKRIWNEGL